MHVLLHCYRRMTVYLFETLQHYKNKVVILAKYLASMTILTTHILWIQCLNIYFQFPVHSLILWFGNQTLIAHNDLNFNAANNCQYLKDDCLHFRIVTVESLSEPVVFPTALTMTNFEQYKIDRDRWYSQPFYTHPQGYKVCLSVVANGSGKGKGTYVSVFAYLMRGEFDDHLKWSCYCCNTEPVGGQQPHHKNYWI